MSEQLLLLILTSQTIWTCNFACIETASWEEKVTIRLTEVDMRV